MKKLNNIASMILIVLFVLSGCGQNSKAAAKSFRPPTKFSNVKSSVVDENDQFVLNWDNDTKCVLLQDKVTGQIWSTTPYDIYKNGETGYSVSSPVTIDYYNPEDNSIQTDKALDCIEAGTVSSVIKDKKLSVAYYFETAQIIVVVNFELNHNSLKVYFNSNGIVEFGTKKLINVGLVPYLCSTENSVDSTNYLFVPAGSGALMYTNEDNSGYAREFSGEVYGYDPARTKLDNPENEEFIRLPCFGAKDGEYALTGIIEENAGAASIYASSGNSDTGYSTVYASFNVRGFNNIEWKAGSYNAIAITNDVAMLNEIIPENKVFSVGYYPLSGAAANYNGMAKCYRNYLKSNSMLNGSDSKQSQYQVTLIGGALTKSNLFGLPYQEFVSLTSLEQAKEILNTLYDKYNSYPTVMLKGFGNSGNNIKNIAGGFGIASELGGEKGLEDFEDYCKKANVDLFTDFELVRFSDSANGFHTFFDSAQTANSETVSYNPIKINVRTENDKAENVKFLSRSSLSKAVNKLLKFCDSRVSGISLSSLASIAYSDYKEQDYMLKGSLEKQFKETYDKINASEHKLFLSAANSYAAGFSDGITSAPLSNGKYYVFDEMIPFYEMIYKGIVPLYTEPINLSENDNELLLRAVEAGVSPSFTLSYDNDNRLASNNDIPYYGIKFDSNCEIMDDILQKTKDFFARISEEEIQQHSILSDGVTKTVFDDGTTVLVNHSDYKVNIEGQSIEARSFVY